MKNKLLFSAIAVITLLSSCSTQRYIYTASPPNNPYFIEKGESKLTAYYSVNGGNNMSEQKFARGLDLQGAYAIGNHWAVTASYFNRREKDVDGPSAGSSPFDSSAVKYKRNLFEVGTGYFTALNKQKTFTLNFYAGMAFGEFNIDDNGIIAGTEEYNRFHNSGISKWFFQPSINFMPSQQVRLSFVLKSSYVHYKNKGTSYTASELDRLSLTVTDNGTLNFIEPAWNIQLGLPEWPWLKLDFTISGVSGQARYKEYIRANNASIGLSVDFSKTVRKRASK